MARSKRGRAAIETRLQRAIQTLWDRTGAKPVDILVKSMPVRIRTVSASCGGYT